MNWLSIFQDRTFGASRSSFWNRFRQVHIKKECEVCGSKWFLELHHILPFHKFPTKELDESNVVTLCRKCHREWGHYFSWQSWNDKIKEDIIRIKNRP